jgi:cation diffusion facilitator family transporter
MHDDARRARGERAHRLGVLVNALLAVFKIGGGALSGSPSLLADGFHSIADLVTNAVAWFSFRVARRPADEDHHYGHGKAEALAGAFVGAVLVVAGASVVWEAFALERPEYKGWEAPIALSFAAVSVAVKGGSPH